MKKIIYLCYMPLYSKTEEDFYIDYLLKNKINVEYWDLTNIYFRSLKFSDGLDRNYIRKIDSLDDFEKALLKEELNNVIFVAMVTYQTMVLRLYRILSKYNCKLLFFSRGILPTPFREVKNILPRLLNSLYSFNLKLIAKKLYNNIVPVFYKRLKLIKDYDVVFTAGNVAIRLHKNNSKIVSINHFDYDKYSMIKNTDNRLLEGRYCVFLDEFYAQHPDNEMLGRKTINPNKYYQALNSFFEKIEEKYGLAVVIAAHPKSNYCDNGVFNNRLIFKYKTDELVKDCEFVITHMSTSVSYAVLYKKPILFIYTDGIKKMYFSSDFKMIINFANVLNCNVYNIDSIRSKDEVYLKEVDLEKYTAYKYDYITSLESQNRLTKDIFWEYLTTYEKT